MSAPLHTPVSDTRPTVTQPETNADAPRGFVQLPNEVLFDPRLTGEDIRLYAVLLSYARQKVECWPSEERLARDIGAESVRTVQRRLAKLKTAGFVGIRRRGRGRANAYLILCPAGPNDKTRQSCRVKERAQEPLQESAESPLAPIDATVHAPEPVVICRVEVQEGKNTTTTQDTTKAFDVPSDATSSPERPNVNGTAVQPESVVVNDGGNGRQRPPPCSQIKPPPTKIPPRDEVLQAMLDIGFEENPTRKGRRSAGEVLYQFGIEACWRAVIEVRTCGAKNPAGRAHNAAEGYAKQTGYLPPRRAFDRKSLESDGGDMGFIHEFLAEDRSGMRVARAVS